MLSSTYKQPNPTKCSKSPPLHYLKDSSTCKGIGALVDQNQNKASEMRGQQLATSNIVSTSDKSDQIIQFLSLPAKANSVTDQWTLKTIELVF